ncbi:MAG: hypothetical protein H0V82_00375 [Candidatus Protochlamydia sp.]|nr:hypothetical protein [Candidatus Protochlamydia sp.]
MIISILSLILAGMALLYPYSLPPLLSAACMLLGGALILFLTSLSQTLNLIPLTNLEQKLVPNLIELYRRDRRLGFGRFWLYLFAFLSFAAAMLLFAADFPFQQWILPAWIVLFGISLDILKDSWQSMLRFLNPFYLVNVFERDAKKAIQNEKDEVLWSSIDSLSEIALRSVEKSKIALSNQTLQTFPPVIQAFFASSKSISRVNLDKETEKATGRDEASYTIFYLLQKLELINDRALQNRLETVCRQMIMVMGKIIIASAKFDLSMVSFPTHFLSKFGLKAQQHHFAEVADLTTSTLLEIARTILTEIDVTYAELQEPFRAILNGLDALAKGSFKKDKNTSIQVLTQPFKDIRTLLETEKMDKHTDTPVILNEIDRIIDEFTALEQVMRAIPAIPEMTGSDIPPS